jgi:hypothetical protein
VRVRALGGDRAGEMRITRFLRHRRVSVGEMVATALARTAALVAGRQILAIQDTTSLRDDGKANSLVLHPTIAVDARDGALLGLVHADLLRRSGGQTAARRSRPVEAKQSRRWLDGTRAAAELAATAGAARVTVIADREGDIYEEFACKPASPDFSRRPPRQSVRAKAVLKQIAGEPVWAPGADFGRARSSPPLSPRRSGREYVDPGSLVRQRAPATAVRRACASAYSSW